MHLIRNWMWWCNMAKSLSCEWSPEVKWNNSTFSVSTTFTIFATEMTRSFIQHRGQRLRLTRDSAGSGHHSLFSLRAPLPSPFLPSPSQWLANGGTARNTYAAAASSLWPCEEIAVCASAPEVFQDIKNSPTIDQPSECRTLRQQTDTFPRRKHPIVRLIRLYG